MGRRKCDLRFLVPLVWGEAFDFGGYLHIEE